MHIVSWDELKNGIRRLNMHDRVHGYYDIFEMWALAPGVGFQRQFTSKSPSHTIDESSNQTMFLGRQSHGNSLEETHRVFVSSYRTRRYVLLLPY